MKFSVKILLFICLSSYITCTPSYIEESVLNRELGSSPPPAKPTAKYVKVTP